MNHRKHFSKTSATAAASRPSTRSAGARQTINPASKQVNPSARDRLPHEQKPSGSVTARGLSSKSKMMKQKRQIRNGKSLTPSALQSYFSDNSGYETDKIPDEDWEPIMERISKSSQEIREVYGMSTPCEADGCYDNRSSTVSVGPTGYSEQGRADGVQMPPGSSPAVREDVRNPAEATASELQY
ncbi:hypothetical protein LTR96_011918 [Exophiala xenobiotica]|nr:hypothetical protein LTR96_011918 [Exophiala xenobiotica]KAK5278997.1 hypothetical protein LTR14_012394 [Exophiala xenobiotica]KAK5319266.1 hypothetical protein LTR98_011911 [Exophiala xenobiotica]